MVIAFSVSLDCSDLKYSRNKMSSKFEHSPDEPAENQVLSGIKGKLEEAVNVRHSNLTSIKYYDWHKK